MVQNKDDAEAEAGQYWTKEHREGRLYTKEAETYSFGRHRQNGDKLRVKTRTRLRLERRWTKEETKEERHDHIL